MKIHRHNVAMRWITRRRTNEVAGLYESFPGTFSAYQEALSSGFQGTMEEFIDEADHLDLKGIADESLIKKADGGRVNLSKGGLAHVLGV